MSYEIFNEQLIINCFETFLIKQFLLVTIYESFSFIKQKRDVNSCKKFDSKKFVVRF